MLINNIIIQHRKTLENIYDTIVEKYTNVDLIIVDEAQFLSEKQVNQLMDVVIDLNIPVVFQDERLTSFEAEDFMSNYIDSKRIKKNVDKLAAFYILESFVLMGT